jgi:hypothetical protein
MMKKFLYLIAILFCFNVTSEAKPGDTTWVQANVAQLGGYGNYDSVVLFPSAVTTYRSIYMIFTLGKYKCPGYDPNNAAATGWCGDWDYTVQNYLLTPGGQTFELGRLITPYANALNPRTPWTATQHYVYDVTDYAMVLKDSGKIRIAYSGYSGGFTANIKFMFIEGVPDRQVLGVQRLWGGSFGYGGTPSINSHFPAITGTAPEFTKSATLKFTVTGHGSDGNGCCEFASHNYQVLLNGGTVANTPIWRDNCGMNELYPESGTWIYNRGNWCPGAIVYANFHDLPGVVSNAPYTIGLQFDPYTGGGSYTTEGTLFFYGGLKKILDASIDQVIAPTNDDNHFRENPICSNPVLHVKNRGSSEIDSITFVYGIKDSLVQSYTWVGRLKTFEESDVTLPALPALNAIANDTNIYKFTAKIAAVNGSSDADATNNVMSAYFVAAKLWPSKFNIAFTTGNEAIAPGSTISEKSWAIFDMDNNIVKQRSNVKISAIYRDTISLPTGCYKLVISDSSCDGLTWWANQSGSITSGSFYARTMGGSSILMKGYTYGGGYSVPYANDFGCSYTQYFSVNTPNYIENIAESPVRIEAYPNPARNTVYVDVSGMQQVKGELHLIDALGRVVSVTKCSDAHQQLNIEGLANGVYTVLFINTDSGNKLTTRLLIAK